MSAENDSDFVEIVHAIPAHSFFEFSDVLGRYRIRHSDVEHLIRIGWLIEYRGYVHFSVEAIRSAIDGRIDRIMYPSSQSRLVPLAFVPPFDGRRVGVVGRFFRWLVGWPKHEK